MNGGVTQIDLFEAADAPLVVRVLPDRKGPDKEFDYLVPDKFADVVRVGSLVRVDLAGRRVSGWITRVGSEPPARTKLVPLAHVRGLGPSPEIIDLCRWAARRWAGRTAAFLTTASPERAVTGLPPLHQGRPQGPPPPHPIELDDALATTTQTATARILRWPPALDPLVVAQVAGRRGPALVLVPALSTARRLADRLREAGLPVALLPDDWAVAAAGGCTVVGTRAAAFGPVPGLRSVVVVDAHDEAYTSEGAPTWNGAVVAEERARRAGMPCVWLSACPTLEMLNGRPLLRLPALDERRYWARVEVVDRRDDDPFHGPFSERLGHALRHSKRAVCVLNRKGRARVLACLACKEVTRCERCLAAVGDGATSDRLVCPHCGSERPRVCQACGSGRLKVVRAGVTKTAEELSGLVRAPVQEVSADQHVIPTRGVMVGTEAVLHRVGRADLVAFLDFDAELLAPRYGAAEQAMVLLARAARMVGGRDAGRGRVLIQTRMPDHPVIRAAANGDPALVGESEAPLREALRFPPAVALAQVSGAGAAVYAAGLAEQPRLAVTGPDNQGGWLVRAAEHDSLLNGLAAVARPAERLRVDVDPVRI